MGVEQYNLVAHDWLNLEFIINDLTQRVVGQELSPGSSPIWAGVTITGKLVVGSQASPVDVTSTRQHGFELHYSGNDYDVTGIRSRAQLVTTDTTATAQGALLQAANNDGIDAGVLQGALIEAIGKSTANAATISTMRGALIGAEWGAFDTVTALNALHVRVHSLNNAGAGSFGTGYGIYIENEAVGGNGQALDAGIYFKGTNLSGGNSAFTYGIDFTGATYATADIKVTEDGTIGGSSADLRVTSNNQVIINKTSATYPFLIKSTDGSDQIGIHHTNTQAVFTTTDGFFVFKTNEVGADTGILVGEGGTGRGVLQVYNQDSDGFILFSPFNDLALLGGAGSMTELIFQNNAAIPIKMFAAATEGETQPLQIMGYGTGSGSQKTFSIEVEKGDVADTIYLDGLTNYLLGGNLITLNDTHEDTDGGGETIWTGKREDGAGTQTSAAKIEISHDGAVANDQLGKIVASVNTGSGLVDAMTLDSNLDAFFAKAKITAIGGYAIKLTNNTGVNSVEGQLVEADDTDENSYKTADANALDVIGVVYNAGVADGSEVWIVIAGIAEVLLDAGGCVHHDRLITSATAGSADVNNAPAVAVHFQEIGHAIETVVGAGLAKAIIHFL